VNISFIGTSIYWWRKLEYHQKNCWDATSHLKLYHIHHVHVLGIAWFAKVTFLQRLVIRIDKTWRHGRYNSNIVESGIKHS